MEKKKHKKKAPLEKGKKCYDCKSTFTFNSSDVNVDREGAYVICPFCSKFNAV